MKTFITKSVQTQSKQHQNKMVLTAHQLTSFFEDANQMGLSNRTRLHLQTEGITDPVDLIDFVTKDSWDPIVDNCKRPPQIPGPGQGAGVFVNQQAFHLPAKSLMRLKTAAQVVLYYDRTGRTLTAPSLVWARMTNFKIEWGSLKEQKDSNDDGNLPIISQKLVIANFFEAYEIFVSNYIGQSGCPLSWIYRTSVAVPAVAPGLEMDQPYSAEHGSVSEEMVQRMPHTHPLYRPDNATGYSHLVTATLGTQYASTIAPFKRSKDGRGALFALKAQFAGAAHWDREVRTMTDFIHNSRFTGTTGFSLHAFLAKHRASYHTLQRCAEHVQVEIPNERSRVGYLLDNIDCQDRDVTTALSHIRLDDTQQGMRSDFERAVAFLLPTDPVKKKKRGEKRNAGQISATVAAANGGGGGGKKGSLKNNGKKTQFKSTFGTTGVEFRFYKTPEFNNLTDDQNDELRAHRKANGNYKGTWTGKERTNTGNNFGCAQVAAMIKSNEVDKVKESTERDAIKASLMEEFRSIISSQMVEAPAKRLKTAGAKVAAATSTNDTDVAERCASALLEKFANMGSKAPSKTG